MLSNQELLRRVKENAKRLGGCKKHDFSIDITPERKTEKVYKCSKCRGIVTAEGKFWYEKGLYDAKAGE